MATPSSRFVRRYSQLRPLSHISLQECDLEILLRSRNVRGNIRGDERCSESRRVCKALQETGFTSNCVLNYPPEPLACAVETRRPRNSTLDPLENNFSSHFRDIKLRVRLGRECNDLPGREMPATY